MISNGKLLHGNSAPFGAGPEKLLAAAPPRPKAALRELLTAFEYARQVDRDAWDFAVTIEELRASGLTESDFRWLACEGIVQHAREITRLEDETRQFRATNPLVFTKRTCFVLTEEGRKVARSLFPADAVPQLADKHIRVHAGQDLSPPHERVPGETGERSVRPCWEADRHELRLNGLIIKQFKWPAANQEIILCAFQEEGWPFCIDDPLPPHPDQDSKRRLSDTIKCLNRKQKNPLIHFRGDGTGEGVIWEVVERVPRP